MNSILWTVIQHRGDSYDIQGVFSSEEKAIQACKGHSYGYGPMVLDEELPEEESEWEGFIYPFRSHNPKITIACPSCNHQFIIDGPYDNDPGDSIICPMCGFNTSKWTYCYIGEVVADDRNENSSL